MAAFNPYVAVSEPLTSSLPLGLAVPIPKYALELSQKSFELLCVIAPPTPINGTDPAVKLETVKMGRDTPPENVEVPEPETVKIPSAEMLVPIEVAA